MSSDAGGSWGLTSANHRLRFCGCPFDDKHCAVTHRAHGEGRQAHHWERSRVVSTLGVIATRLESLTNIKYTHSIAKH